CPLDAAIDMQLMGGLDFAGECLLHGAAPVPYGIERPHIDRLRVDGGKKGSGRINLRGPRKSASDGDLLARDQAAPGTLLLLDLLLDEVPVEILRVGNNADSWLHVLLTLVDEVPGRFDRFASRGVQLRMNVTSRNRLPGRHQATPPSPNRWLLPRCTVNCPPVPELSLNLTVRPTFRRRSCASRSRTDRAPAASLPLPRPAAASRRSVASEKIPQE